MEEERIDIGDWKNPLLNKVVGSLFVRGGKCDVCGDSKPVLFMESNISPMFTGCVCLDCVESGFELYAIKNRTMIPKLIYREPLAGLKTKHKT
jgi:hypothetical protein